MIQQTVSNRIADITKNGKVSEFCIPPSSLQLYNVWNISKTRKEEELGVSL